MSRNEFSLWLPAAILISLVGCQPAVQPSPAPPIRVAKSDKPDAANDKPPVVEKQVAPEKPEPDAPPVVAVKTLLAEIDAGYLDAFAEFLPESHHKELESTLKALIAKAPDSLWARGQSLAAKTTSVIQRKLDLVTPNDERRHDDENRAQLAAALERLADPATWKRETWQTAGLQDMLKGPASDVLTVWQAVSPQGSALSAQTDVRLIKLEGDAAVLSFQSPVDPEPREVDFVKVDDHWIPKSLADGWKSTLQPWRDQIEKLPEAELAEAAAKLDPHLQVIEGTLDEMLKAEHADEVQLGWWQIQSILLAARQELLQPGPAPRVELRFAGTVGEKDLSRLLSQLVEVSDQPELAEYVTFPTTNGMTIHLSPVNDVPAFVKRLTFVKVISSTERQVELAP